MNLNEEAKLRAEATRGMRANELMSDEIMVEAFTLLDQRLTNEWANSPARDTDGRERLWMMLKLLKSVEGHLKEVATTGKMASLKLEQERTLMQRAKQWATEL
jgi:hypothetical protein